MPSPKGLDPRDLEEQARILQQLIEDAQALQKEISEHLRKARADSRLNAQPIRERRKKPR
jgi:hypothetical protein